MGIAQAILRSNWGCSHESKAMLADISQLHNLSATSCADFQYLPAKVADPVYIKGLLLLAFPHGMFTRSPVCTSMEKKGFDPLSTVAMRELTGPRSSISQMIAVTFSDKAEHFIEEETVYVSFKSEEPLSTDFSKEVMEEIPSKDVFFFWALADRKKT